MRVIKNIEIKNIIIDRIPYTNTLKYAIALQNGDIFPPIKVALKKDGRFEIRDGRHRVTAHRLVGKKYIKARFSENILKTEFER